jgi:hypothetical protein
LGDTLIGRSVRGHRRNWPFGQRSIINSMSEAIKLNAREELIQRVLQMTEDEANLFLEAIEDIEDEKAFDEHKGEHGVPFEEVLKELGFTYEQVIGKARAEGLV